MSLAAGDAWERILSCAKRDIAEQTFRMWLEPLVPIAFTGTELLLAAPDQFSVEWLTSKYATMLTALAPMALGFPCAVGFSVDERTRDRIQMDLFARPSAAAKPMPARQATAIPRPILSTRYTFDQFVIGKSNELAAAAALAIADAPGRVYNPFFIHGPTGLGKTHLMQAIAHEILVRKPEFRIIYLGAEQFTNEYVTAIQSRAMPAFRTRFREADLLLIDDVHFLKNKEGTQEEFFHTFNALYEAGRQIVVTSDRSPSEVTGIESRLITRFQWGLVADITVPDLEHRIAILRKKAQVDQLERTIPDNVIRLLAEHVQGSVRELEGAIVRLLAFASLKHREITLSTAADAFNDRFQDPSTLSNGRPPITPETIQAAVAAVWNVSVADLRSKSRLKTLTIPRQAAMHLCRELLHLQLVEIGSAFSDRDHSTVIHSLGRAKEQLASEPSFQANYQHAWLSLTGIPYVATPEQEREGSA
ncbi:MAG: Chromosomal replication initiator protein DnaA [Gemmatimonadaceae bacterium]|nr:Chromosomal replication initiator protein DnaA [Gemmatimonadaceae bacterium]